MNYTTVKKTETVTCTPCAIIHHWGVEGEKREWIQMWPMSSVTMKMKREVYPNTTKDITETVYEGKKWTWSNVCKQMRTDSEVYPNATWNNANPKRKEPWGVSKCDVNCHWSNEDGTMKCTSTNVTHVIITCNEGGTVACVQIWHESSLSERARKTWVNLNLTWVITGVNEDGTVKCVRMWRKSSLMQRGVNGKCIPVCHKPSLM